MAFKARLNLVPADPVKLTFCRSPFLGVLQVRLNCLHFFFYTSEYCHNFSNLSSLDFLTSSSCPFFVSNFKNRFTEV